MASSSVPTRHNRSLLAASERRLLVRIATRLPAGLRPDHLTAIGVVGAAVVLIGYVSSVSDVRLLWLANFGLLLHWFGDSLDGTVARVRSIERPHYGFFVDQTIDTLSNLLVAVGIGSSPWARLDVSLLVLAAYHMVSISILAEAVADAKFSVSVFGLGPTELRIGIIAMNLGILVFGAPRFEVFSVMVTWCDLLMIVLFLVILVIFTIQYVSTAARLARSDK